MMSNDVRVWRSGSEQPEPLRQGGIRLARCLSLYLLHYIPDILDISEISAIPVISDIADITATFSS
jgi:hypothetical protein